MENYFQKYVKNQMRYKVFTGVSFGKESLLGLGRGLCGLRSLGSGLRGGLLLLVDPVLVRQVDPEEEDEPEDEEADDADAQAEVEVGHPPGPDEAGAHHVVAGGGVAGVVVAAAAQVGDGLGAGGGRGGHGVGVGVFPLVA